MSLTLFGVEKRQQRHLNRLSRLSRENDARAPLCPVRPPGIQRRQSGLLHRDRKCAGKENKNEREREKLIG